MLPEKKRFKIIELIREFNHFKNTNFTIHDFAKLGFNKELITSVIEELKRSETKTQNIGVIACPSYIREKFDEMDQEYYGRIITLSKNTTSLLENKIVIVYIDNLLNLGKEYEDLSEKDQRLVHSIYGAYELYSFMRELLVTNGSITRIIKRLCMAMEEFYPTFKKQFERFHRY